MTAAAGCDMAAIVVEFFSSQPISARLFDEHRVDLFEFVPITRWRQIHFQNAGVRSNAERSHPGIGGRSVALQPYRLMQILARILDCGDQIEIVSEPVGIWQKNVQAALSSL